MPPSLQKAQLFVTPQQMWNISLGLFRCNGWILSSCIYLSVAYPQFCLLHRHWEPSLSVTKPHVLWDLKSVERINTKPIVTLLQPSPSCFLVACGAEAPVPLMRIYSYWGHRFCKSTVSRFIFYTNMIAKHDSWLFSFNKPHALVVTNLKYLSRSIKLKKNSYDNL